ncbi:MAG: ABC transporter substrate-binding protein [Bacteroidales bacterium]
MIIKEIISFLLIGSLGLMAGCHHPARPGRPDGGQPTQIAPTAQHAQCFRVQEMPDGVLLTLTDPRRQERILAQFLLQDENQAGEAAGSFTTIQVPVETIVASSTTHTGFLTHLGAGHLLSGMNNPERLYDSILYQRYLDGSLLKMGRDLEYNLEHLVSARPSVILQTGIDGQFNPDARLRESGIPVVYILEWMESTPLGRAEWIKVFGLLTGRRALADSLFDQVEQHYRTLCAKVGEVDERLTVFTGTDFKGTWYVPGGRNYLANFFRDAGLKYPWAGIDQSASLALSFEAVYNQAGQAELWIGVPVDSISQLLAIEKRYANFRAVREQRVYSLTNRVNPHGGNDYWEGGVVRPDLILEDLIAIAWPGQLPEHCWNFFKPLIFN